MAQPSISAIFTGSGNQGLQVGHNSGSIYVAAAEHPETPPQPSCFVPFRRDLEFIPRETLLDQIRERCAAPASRVALVGFGGVGKSQLAIEHCHRTAEQSPKTWVFWVHAGDPARLQQSFHEIAEQAKVRGRNDPQADVFKLVHDWLRDQRSGSWLMVLDNADDTTVLSPSSSNNLKQHLWRYLPPSKHGSVLVTSRTKRAAAHFVDDNDIIPIEPMHDAAAHALLHKKLGDGICKNEDVAELAAGLDYMPLALVQAAAYIRERAPRCSVQQYLEQYRQSDSGKTSLLDREAGHLRRDKAASNSILLTWQISFEHIQSKRPSAAGLLSLMSFFERQGIQESLLRTETSTTDDSFEEDILTLRDYSFIKITKDEKTFEMHSLVQLATRKWLESQGQVVRWRNQFISRLCAELPTGEFETWAKCQALFPHARAALAQRPEGTESLKQWARLLFKAASYANRQGRAGEAEHMSTVSMEVFRQVCGEENKATLWSMVIVGLAKINGGKYEEAESICRQTLAIQEKVLGHEHPATLKTMNNLGVVLENQGKYEEAKSIYRQTLAIHEKVLGHEHRDTLVTMNNLGNVLFDQSKYEEAGSIYRQTLAIQEKVLGHEHPDTLLSVFNLASLLANRHCYDESLALFERACAGSDKVLGEEHPDSRRSRQRYAVVKMRATRAKTHAREDEVDATGDNVQATEEQMHATEGEVDATGDNMQATGDNVQVIGDNVQATEEKMHTNKSKPSKWTRTLSKLSFRSSKSHDTSKDSST